MKRQELFLFAYSLIGMTISYLTFCVFENHNIEFLLQKQLPAVNFTKLKFSNNTFEYRIKKKKGLETQVVFFDAFKPDTFFLDDCEGKVNIAQTNMWMMREPSSAKQRAPIYGNDNGFVFASRSINPVHNTCSEWRYTTLFQKRNDFYSVSIITDPSNLFDFYKGIYTNGSTHLFENTKTKFSAAWWLNPGNWQNKGKEWERDAVFQYLDPLGKQVFSASCGIRIHGNASRGFPQKSLRIVADKSHGTASFTYHFFTKKNEKYKSLILRNSGNDWGRTMFADSFIQSCVPEGFVDKQLFVPVEVYINGLYWGIYSLCERPDENFLARKYKTKKSKITIVEGELLDYGNETVKNEFTSMILDCWKEHGNKLDFYNELCEKIDIDNFISYIAIQIYAVNFDLETPNVKAYRIGNGKWRWILKDLDCSYSYSSDHAFETDMFDKLLNSNTTAGVIFKACMYSDQFKKNLKDKINHLLNGPFSKKVQLAKLNALKLKFKNSIAKQISRWRKPSSEFDWNFYINGFAKFIEKREEYLKRHMHKHLMIG